MSCFDLSHRINLFYFDERSECRNKFLSTNLMKNIENMAQIVETIKLADEETEWNKLEYFDSLYNCLSKTNNFRCWSFFYAF